MSLEQVKLSYGIPEKYCPAEDSRLREETLATRLHLDEKPSSDKELTIKEPIGKTFYSISPGNIDVILLPMMEDGENAINEYEMKWTNRFKDLNGLSNNSHKDKENLVQPTTSRKDFTPSTQVRLVTSPSLSHKSGSIKQSTPVSALKEMNINSDIYNSAVKRKTVFEKTIKKSSTRVFDGDESDYDHLACHADNIMKMAVDSTMLGSSFSTSFSLSSMNYDLDNKAEIVAKEEGDKNHLDSVKSKGILSSKDNHFVEISAQDLEAAVQ